MKNNILLLRRIKGSVLVILFICIGIGKLWATDYYWVGGSGDWSDLTHWATTSGGSSHPFIPPSPVDDVIFDANSGFTTGNNTVTTSSSIYCRNMTWNNAPANPIFNESNSNDFLIYGSLTLQASMTYNARVYFTGSIPATITSNGAVINGAVEIEKGSSSITLADNLIVKFVNGTYAYAVTGDIALTSGTFDLAGHDVYANSFYSNNNNTRHINMTNATMWFKTAYSGGSICTAYPYQNSGSNSHCFTYIGSNKTVAATNSLLCMKGGCQGANISGGTQLTFNNMYISSVSVSSYNSSIGNSIFNVITTDMNTYTITSSSGAQIDSLLFNTVTQAWPSYSGSNNNTFNGSGTQINTLIFNGSSDAPTISYNGVTGSSNTIQHLEFRNYDGRITGNSNHILYAEYAVNGYITGTNNTMDTLVLSPGYTYRLGTGVNNYITKALYGSGNPCYLTEILNISTSGTATLTVNTGTQLYLDYVRARGVIAAGTSAPFTTGAHSLDLGNNTNWSFDTYNPGAPLEGIGQDTIMCPSLYPLVLNASGFVGSPHTVYTWYDGAGGLTHSVTGPGIYWVSADYGRGCLLTDSITVTDRFDLAFSGHLPVCTPSAPNGSVVATASGSSGPFSYSWNSSPVQNNDTLIDVPAGTYAVTVTDANGCSYTESTSITGPSTGLDFAVTIPAVSVYPDCDPTSAGSGSASAVTAGGSTPYALSWNTTPIETTATIFNLNAGSYQVIATDANGCKDTAIVAIANQAGAFTGTVSVTNPTGCDTTGNASVSLTGGSAPFSYLWTNDPSETTNYSNDILVGNYSVSIVDNNSCITHLPFQIVSPDITAPVFSNCPHDTIIYNDPGICSAAFSWIPPTASDACGVQSVIASHTPGSSFPLGTTTIMYIATDKVGNKDTCSFTVTIEDHEAPRFVICPGDREVYATIGNCSATVNWAPPVASDNCSGAVSVVGDFSSGTAFPVGTTTVTYVATDASGNKDTCQFRVIVHANPSNFYISTCNSNQSWYTNGTTCYKTVTLGVPTVNNLCGNMFLVPGTYTPGQTYDFPVGVNQVVHRYTNGADTITCSYTITVYDYYAPGYSSFPSTINLMADTCGGRRVSWPLPVFTDACGIDTAYSNHVPGELFPTGSTQVLYTVKDVNGNTNYFSFYVNITDVAPVISACPSNISALADTCAGKRVTWTPPTVTDNCITSFTSNYNPGDLFPVGTTTVTYTAVSGNGATASCSFNVTVNPRYPTISACPSDITIDLDAVTCDTAVSWIPPTFTHPCGIDTVIASHTPGDVYLPGVYNVTYQAISNDGYTSSCSFTLTVNAYATPVTISGCPPSHPIYGTPWYIQQVDTSVLCGWAVVSWPEPKFTTSYCINSVDTVVLTAPFNMGDTINIGTYTIQYEAFDAFGNSLAVCAFTFEVTDTISGVFANGTCPSLPLVQQVNQAAFCGGVVVNFTEPEFTSIGCAAPIDTVVSNIHPGDTLLIGNHNVSYQALDSNGVVIGMCDFIISVVDTISGVTVTCPPTTFSSWFGQNTYNIYIDTSTCAATANWPEPTFTSLGCSGSIDHVVSNYHVGDVLTLGSYNVNYTAYDSLGNQLAECNFIAVVQYNAADFMVYPNDTTFITDPVTCQATVNWNAPVNHNVCGNNFSTGICSSSPNWGLYGGNPYYNNINQQLPAGVYTVQYCTYNGVQYQYHIFTINVVDGSAPTFGTSCPADTVILSSNFNTCQAIAVWQEPVAISGTCSGVSQPVVQTSNYHTGDLLPVGSTDIIYTATSSGGVTSTCQFVATVIDVQKPVFNTCPTNIVASASSTGCNASVNWSAPTAFDNCSGVTIISTHTPGDLFPTGVTAVTYIATDAGGNTDSCTFTVTVIDNVPPVISGCPANIVVSNELNQCGATVSWSAPVASDNCTLSSFTSSVNSGSFFPIGTTTVTYIATDANNLQTMCSFNITVEDTQVPVLLNCPSDMTVSSSFNLCMAQVNWIPPTAGDNCNSSTVITSTHVPGDLFPIGITTVTYYIQDAAGNADSCSFDITVMDTHAPQITACPSSMTVGTDPGLCDATVGWTIPIALDNCSGVTLISNFSSGDQFPIGTTTVTYTATDAQGLTATCSFDITVHDQQAPIFANCPGNISVTTDQNSCDALVSWTAPDVNDNCGVSSVTSDHVSGSLFPTGVTTVTYTATDNNGLTSTCSFTITVADSEKPVFNGCPENITAASDPDSCGITVYWTPPVSSDNCGISSTVSNYKPGSFFEIGQTLVTYITFDNAGNSDTCSFVINVTGNSTNCTILTDIIVPEAFTPDNGDGFNEYFVIQGLENYPNSQLTIFNRWGNIVYETDNYSNDWKGVSDSNMSLGDNKLPSGIYFYILDTHASQGVLKGYVYLKR